MYEKFLKIIDENDGIITTNQAERNGISKMNLKKLVDSGRVKKIERAVYVTDKFVYDDFYLFQIKHPNVVFSYNTALYFHGMTERTPIKMDVTTSRNNSLNYCKNKVNVYRVKKEVLELGKKQIKTPTGKLVNTYNLERTVCDIINNKKNIDIEVANKAIKNCIKSKGFNANLMFEYAKKLKVYEKVETYMEAML